MKPREHAKFSRFCVNSHGIVLLKDKKSTEQLLFTIMSAFTFDGGEKAEQMEREGNEEKKKAGRSETANYSKLITFC